MEIQVAHPGSDEDRTPSDAESREGGEPPPRAKDLPLEAAGEEPGTTAAAGGAAALGSGAAESAAGPAEDFRDRWLRAEAELQNFRRRTMRDLEEARRFSQESVMLEMIGALDDLDRALEAARTAGAPETWIQGVQLVSRRLAEYLARQGVTVMDPVGEPFDPELHEALLEVDAPAGIAPGAVVQVALKGYRRSSRALRPARVVVARRPAGSDA